MNKEDKKILLLAKQKLNEDRIDRIKHNKNIGFGIMFCDSIEYAINPEELLNRGIIGKFMGKDVILK